MAKIASLSLEVKGTREVEERLSIAFLTETLALAGSVYSERARETFLDYRFKIGENRGKKVFLNVFIDFITSVDNVTLSLEIE